MNDKEILISDTNQTPSAGGRNKQRPAPGSAQADIEAVMPRPPIDKQIWGIYILLVCISLIELYSASSREVSEGNIFGPLLRHAMLLGVGFIIMIVMQRIHYNRIGKLTYVIVGLSVLATIYTIFFGSVINGARRSFSLMGVSVQPSELIKLSAALLIAWVLSKAQIKGKVDVTRRAVTEVAVIVLIFGMLLINQGLTNTLLLMAISISMMAIGGVGWKKLGIVLAIYVGMGCCYGVYKFMAHGSEPEKKELKAGVEQDRTAIRANRLSNFFTSDKYKEPITSDNQQEQYSFIAQANGGIIGVGPGNSRETARLPLAFSDYIYAIVIEDMGLIGGLFVMILYLWLLARAGVIASRCKKAYPALLVIGMAVFIVFQALFHMAIVTGVFPVSGQPLPLISKGGSSVIITSFALGIMLSVSRYAARKGRKQQIKDELTTLSDVPTADNPLEVK
ncbi:MAG: FtsW/RodA/SpoVE family cell cycle protein [Muribaculaceae bacterium]|nr:FtsW/RodA/SpoVE family cell cycle protein [Muribaculaceae bacterium]